MRSSIQTWARLGARQSCYQRPASEMNEVLGCDRIFHWYKKSRYFTDPLKKNRLEATAQGTLLSPLWQRQDLGQMLDFFKKCVSLALVESPAPSRAGTEGTTAAVTGRRFDQDEHGIHFPKLCNSFVLARVGLVIIPGAQGESPCVFCSTSGCA